VVQGHNPDPVELIFQQVHCRERMVLTRNIGKGFVRPLVNLGQRSGSFPTIIDSIGRVNS
jgi:hypothetical protein